MFEIFHEQVSYNDSIPVQGVLIGSSFGLASVIWVAVGAMSTTAKNKFWKPLPLSSNDCTSYNGVNVTAPYFFNATETLEATKYDRFVSKISLICAGDCAVSFSVMYSEKLSTQHHHYCTEPSDS